MATSVNQRRSLHDNDHDTNWHKNADAIQDNLNLHSHSDSEKIEKNPDTTDNRRLGLPLHHGKKINKGIKAAGESGRRGFHPLKFLLICFRSSCTLSKYVNFLWPFVPAAFIVYYRTHAELWQFILAYIAIVPSGSLVGFAGQELARKLPHVFGVLLETTLGSVVEIVLFMVLIRRGEGSIPIIQAAILGSILANLLLCLGLCFFAGGLKRQEQVFHEAVSEVGSNLMLVAGMGLVVPAIYYTAAPNANTTAEQLQSQVTKISRATAIILLFSYFAYVFFQMRSHHGIYEDLLLQDEEKDADRHRDLNKPKLTLTESIIALTFALTIVSFMAVFLVDRIEFMVAEYHISDAFLGLILVPLVEKAAEHTSVIDEAWDDQMNFALAHVLGSSIQTALFNTPLVVLVGWGLGYRMNLNFEIFDAVVLILAILVVGNFLRDRKSQWLEGFLCVTVYIIIAISAFFYPDTRATTDTATNSEQVMFGSGTLTPGSAQETAAAELAKRFLQSIGHL